MFPLGTVLGPCHPTKYIEDFTYVRIMNAFNKTTATSALDLQRGTH